ncbi:hypothetical protein ASPCAL08493 [Aspergillus calidoustus]|uniref:AB hydrolase-1 domain-containing protein n=1 Tax=Aspergillus calidoustus TaxID=454130 RepID=A0A0U5GQB5_ASPCI|nr:hypothetical protein ASPCAL08493 [Aspergillus calidoustus]
MTKATNVLVPGAWLAPAFYEPFLNAVSEAGHPIHCAEYPSLNPVDPTTAESENPTPTPLPRRSIASPRVKDAISYSSSAARGLSKTEREKQGRSGGVVGMVFVAAFIVPEGPLPNLNVPSEPTATFAADVDSKLVCKITDNVKPHPTLAFNSPSPAPAWVDEAYSGRLAAIVTMADQAVPQEAQYGMIAATKRDWIIKETECSHCAPFLSRIRECVRLVLGLLGEFERI